MLFLTSAVSYGLHYWVFTYLNPGEPLDIINFAYKFNVGITLLFTGTILLAGKFLKNNLGFVFLINGLVKMGIYLYLIKASGYTLEKSVFLHFFIPYVVCIVVEIIYVIKTINRFNYSNDK